VLVDAYLTMLPRLVRALSRARVVPLAAYAPTVAL